MIQKKKKYGQHFLIDKNIANKIVSGLQSNKPEMILEVGPGEGILTNLLYERFKSELYLVEIDSDLIPVLNQKYPDFKEKIIHSDFLNINLSEIFDQKEIAIIGNFPYNISSQILFKVIEFRNNVVEVVGMFQKEVAKRICSGPGNKDYGILSVLTQAFYQTEYLFSVSKNVFSPQPKVESGVIRLTRKENYKLECNEKIFQRIVKQSFQQRRKQLHNSLRSDFRDASVDDILNKRPEELSWKDFIYLTNLIG